jgi:hypothetical protein
MVSVNRLTANPPGSGATARRVLVESVLHLLSTEPFRHDGGRADLSGARMQNPNCRLTSELEALRRGDQVAAVTFPGGWSVNRE